VDVYQGKYRSENNIFKFALFVSFFPQLMQGPIGRFDRLGHQLYEGHDFNLKNVQFGLQRVGWGVAKKVILADRVAPLVNNIFTYWESYSGFHYLLAVLMYSVQLYMDFSGGIDIVIGVAEMFGIKMDENFRQPYFSKSIGEFWRRWHITLGTWMKDYIFYPMSLSGWMHSFTKWSKKHFGNHVGKTLPICFSNIVIFFVVGVWHGAAWKYVIYGLYNGFIIAFSNMAEPLYKKGLEVCHINAKSKAWSVFQIIRTFILVNIGWYFDMAGSVSSALCMMKYSIFGMCSTQFTSEELLSLGMKAYDYAVVAVGCVIVFAVSLLIEKGVNIRESIAAKPLPVRWLIYYGCFALILIVGYSGNTGGFIYANF
jgi:D-alanyl-lipoteichoic acid acyltransferase DltB (MBOAT superfamily)